nr:MAG TPA: hypothetical protein [Caudoviricetes sp.]
MWLKAGQSNKKRSLFWLLTFPLRVTASFLRAQRESALHQLSVVDDR